MRRRIGTSSEALQGGASGEGASGEAESWYLVRGLAAWASGEPENRPRPRRCLLALIFIRSKQFFRFLLRVPLFMVSDSSPRASGGVRALSLRFLTRLGLQRLPSGLCFVLEASVGARERTHRV